jgi:tetratricopeptide (TPR) repeat protein
VLGIFTILGYFGLKSINQIKENYINELDNLKKIKVDFESQLNLLTQKQKDFESKVETVNETQDRRLKLLELIEKIGGLIRGKQWKWALEHIEVGLKIDSKNLTLLQQQGHCLGKLGQFSKAITSLKKVLESDQAEKGDVIDAIVNILEYLALDNNIVEFNKLISEYQYEIDQHRNDSTTVYLKALVLLTGDAWKDAIQNLIEFASRFKGSQRKHIETWDFDEVLLAAQRWGDETKKKILDETIKFFNGEVSSDSYIDFLSKI